MTEQETEVIIDEIKILNPKLNYWEKQFLGNIIGHRKISKKQEARLLRIYEKTTGGRIYQKRQYI